MRSTHRPRSRRASAVAMLALAVLAAGCTRDDPPATLPTPTDPASPSTTDPTPGETPALDPADAEAEAQDAIHDYLSLFAEISADPEREIAELENVAAERTLDWATHQITTWRQAGQRGVGAQIASDFAVTTVVLDPGTTTESDHPTVELTACVDVSATDVVDQDGNSVITADRLDRVLVDYVVANPNWPNDQHWLVIRDDAQLTTSSPPEFVPCD